MCRCESAWVWSGVGISDPDTTEIHTKTEPADICLLSVFLSQPHKTKSIFCKKKKKKEYLLASVQLAAMHLLPMAHRKEQ